MQESLKILDVKEPLNEKEVKERYEFLFPLNDKTKGGSFYLQSKVRYIQFQFILISRRISY